ncbi:MAG: 2-C-methyl-D-erythritol 4-phosphate cytidylyltransferase [Lachnospiraceae bacterium]|nr:2-C-methyl-D-erythritol 4-phosphate cytidylyltransferase [Lachnospiraceae bacterium]
MKTAAVVLAGGSGSRMHSNVKKQYMLIGDKPVLYYSLNAFQSSRRIDEIVLVCSENDIDRCRKEIVEAFGITKARKIVAGGKERHDSVYEGLKALSDCDYVMIHDGARPFVDEAMIERIWAELPQVRACTVGMPVKDTIKMSNESGYVEKTLPREKLWMIQTPQSFSYELILHAHEQRIQNDLEELKITDDAMLVEYKEGVPVKLIEGSYENIKITTPEDLTLAEAIWGHRFA